MSLPTPQQKRWRLLETPKPETDALHQLLKISPTICSILAQRGLQGLDDSKAYFRPSLDGLHSPWLMKDMDKAVTRILHAFDTKEHILVFGDYDVDGTTAVACMFQFLKALHTHITFYIPHRYKEGYGISKLGIDYAKSIGCTLIISLDCGIKSVELIDYAQQIGIDFIVCDHHLPDAILPPAVAILNAKQPNCAYPFKELCGCGVGFKLMMALSEALNLPPESYYRFLDLNAIAIAADIVPLIGENRILAFFGLQQINTSPCAGVKALMHLGGLKQKVTLGNLVFIIAPRVNAAGRMDDASKAVQLFIEQDADAAFSLAELLHQDNTDRKEADSSITEQALEMIAKDPALHHSKTTVVYNPDWHKGVVGIVASRLIETYYRPTVVLTKSGDYVAGSARSVIGFNLYEAIHACKAHLLGYGGHFAAAGMTLLPENVAAFAASFEKIVSETIPPELLIPEIVIDSIINFKEITPAFFNILEQMQPFGPLNMRPVFIAKGVVETGFSKIVKELHIRFVVMQHNCTITGIGFNLANKFELLAPSALIDIVFTLDWNEFNGRGSVQLRVIDFNISTN